MVIWQNYCNSMLELLVLCLIVAVNGQKEISINPNSLGILLNEEATVNFTFNEELYDYIVVNLNSSAELGIDPNRLIFNQNVKKRELKVKGTAVTSRGFVNIQGCYNLKSQFNLQNIFLTVTVFRSRFLSALIQIVGWIYFAAWSISFWPQIVLNFQRRSVVGLNFDFIVLNILGFTCYTIYNVTLFFIPTIQNDYYVEFPQSSIPVTIPDLAFALHALLASILTGIQCLIYERDNQRISYTCIAWTVVLILFASGSLIAALTHALNWFNFITCLSYVKMAVSLSKYTPQAIMNFRRSSTLGMSIGNFLLDFTGGMFSILQMILIGWNTNDWSGFLSNKVKFGLGMISIIFDCLFIFQHYCLYRNT
ncbi:Cystinosin [Aphelenchoides besseyi]|nr:Cystinosin [Aphelenchoides besseyi]KAI6195140.1 Cystinosin [Aphelenchoides besseyi]